MDCGSEAVDRHALARRIGGGTEEKKYRDVGKERKPLLVLRSDRGSFVPPLKLKNSADEETIHFVF